MSNGHAITINRSPSTSSSAPTASRSPNRTGAVGLAETGKSPRDYLPRDDVRLELLDCTDKATAFPSKGQASYWSAKFGDRVHDNIIWTKVAAARGRCLSLRRPSSRDQRGAEVRTPETYPEIA